MMARRVTPQDKAKFHELYAILGTYIAVAKATGFSDTTVSRHIKKGIPAAASVTLTQTKSLSLSMNPL